MPPHEMPVVGIIEDDPVMGGSLAHRLELEGYGVRWWRSGREALAGLDESRPSLLISDIRLGDMDGEQVFLSALPKLGATPVLFVTGFAQLEQAVRLTKAGAADYIAKPYVLTELLERIRTLTARRGPEPKGELGRSPEMCWVELLIERVANIDSTLLFTGESGVGKEVAARYLHRISARARGPFVAVNCAAIPGELIESELFGHERGAFTSAHARHEGYVARARGGILFLDEIGELPLAVQPKLLRLIQERTFSRVGGSTVIPAEIRIVCATNIDLEQAAASGRFRQDLYYRINVIPVPIAPLRERLADILPLARGFIADFAEAFDRRVVGLTPNAEQAAIAHPWPGNVRELRNRIERAVALSTEPWLTAADLFSSAAPGARKSELLPLAEARASAERQHILAALKQADGQVTRAAEILGVSRSTLFEKIKRLGIDSGEPG